MGWIFGIAVTAALLVTGAAGFACVAVYKISKCQLD
jgi:hypothetical protein